MTSSLRDIHSSLKDAGDGHWHAQLTSAGEKKLRTHSKAKLEPGKDYVIKETTADDDWITMGTGSMVQRLRHDWIIVPRFRPHVPVVYTSTTVSVRSKIKHSYFSFSSARSP